MSVIAVAVKHLLAAGVTGDDLVRAVAEMENSMPSSKDAAAEKRRAYDRERKRAVRMSGGIPVEPVESADTSVPPNDIYSNPPEPLSAKADIPPILEKVVSAWNEVARKSGLSEARALNPRRTAGLRARIKEHGETAVFEAIRNVSSSKFHCGANDRGWKADLGWLLTSPENFQKILELPSSCADPPRRLSVVNGDWVSPC